MTTHSAAKPFGIAMTLVIIACACSRSTPRPAAIDTARREMNTARSERIRVPDDARLICDSVALTWRRVAEAKVTTIDTLILPRTDDSAKAEVSACRVLAAMDSVVDSNRVAQTYWRATHWPELIRWQADGPDGESGIRQRGLTRCEVARQWDGGDDSDTTVAISPFQEETTICWHHPTPVTAADTGFPEAQPSTPPAGVIMGTIISRPPGKRPPR